MQHNSKNWFRIRKNEHCECQFSAVWLAEKHHQYSPCLYFYPITLTSLFCTHLRSTVWGWGVSLHRPIEIKGDYYDPFSDVIIFSRFCSWKNNTTQSIYVGKNNVTFSHLHFMTIFYVCIPFYISKYLLSSNFKNNLKILSQKHLIFSFFN